MTLFETMGLWRGLRHELREMNGQGFRELLDVQKGDIPLTSLYTADVRPVEAGERGKFLLGNSCAPAEHPQPLAKAYQHGGQGCRLQ